MGYTTDFSGEFKTSRPLTLTEVNFLKKFAETRRMKRNVAPEFGVEGEFYVDGGGYAGQDAESNIIDYNNPPSTQPGLWCQWVPNEDGTAIEWDGNEKFYDYVEWIKYLIENFFKKWDVQLNGEVEWEGEERGDLGLIRIKDNEVTVLEGRVTYDG